MSHNETTTAKPAASSHSAANEAEVDRVIKRLGGRHLIFRTQFQSNRLVPHPYALVSDFSGAVWFFYGLGQVWLTHKKYRDFDGWTARVPRLGGSNLIRLIDQLTDAITDFTHHCNEQGIEGTLVIETGMIEFHWTFGYALAKEKMKPEKSVVLDREFHQLVEQFLAAKRELGF